MRAATKTIMLVLATAFGGCLLPEYTVDDNLGGQGGSGGSLPELPPPPANCNGPSGPTMVPVRGGYCMDATEVTWGDYGTWALTASQDPNFASSQPPECSWNTNPNPGAGMGCKVPVFVDGPQYPVVCVDWCDARAYCTAQGKRLCGKIGGGSLGLAEYLDPAQSQWMNVCSSGGRYTYPYGDTFTASQCHALGTSQAQPSKTLGYPTCQSTESGYLGVYDLSGNVAEWEDACNGSVGAGDKCRIRGGSFTETSERASCGADQAVTRDSGVDYIGFRCCWDPPS